MTPDLADEILRDYEALRDPDADPELEAVKAAIFLEDAFGITLSEPEIRRGVLGTTAGMRALVLGGRDTGGTG